MITILLKKGFNICLNKRECYKQWSTENASEKMKVDLMLVKNAGWKPTRTMFAMSNTYLHLFIVNDKEPEDFPFWNIFVSSVKNYKIIHLMKWRRSGTYEIQWNTKLKFYTQCHFLIEPSSSVSSDRFLFSWRVVLQKLEV